MSCKALLILFKFQNLALWTRSEKDSLWVRALESLCRIQHNAVLACQGHDFLSLAGKDRHVAQRKMRCSRFSEKVWLHSLSLGHGSDILLHSAKRIQCPTPLKGVQKGRALRTRMITFLAKGTNFHLSPKNGILI